MKKLFFALLFVFPFAHAMDFSLEKDECIILVASTKSETEARAIANKYPGAQLYASKSGYIAIGLEKISKQESAARIKELLSAGKIPKGANCADNTRITGLLADGEVTAQNTSKDTIAPNTKSEKRNPSNNCAAYTDPIAQIRCVKQNESGGTYEAPESKLLNCGVNVNCQNKSEIIEKMRTAWLKLRNAGGIAGAYADVCFDSFKLVKELNPAVTINAGIIQPQLNACNVGLREIR
jgi:hypothetical protein